MEHVGRAAESLLDTVYALLSSLPCGAGSTQVLLNGHAYDVVKLLGEGGFSLVYLVQDPTSGQQFALKKVGRAPHADPVPVRRGIRARGTCRGRCDASLPRP